MNQERAFAALNAYFGGRRQHRAAYRGYLKKNGVPKMRFEKISDRRAFNHLNRLTFIEDLQKAIAKAQAAQT